jgi:hypothetical protein
MGISGDTLREALLALSPEYMEILQMKSRIKRTFVCN